MFYTIDEESSDIDIALRWYNAGKVVSVSGWVKGTRAGKEKDLSGQKFEDIIKLYPKWKITTAPVRLNRIQDRRNSYFSLRSMSSNDHKQAKELRREKIRQANAVMDRVGVGPVIDEKRELMPKAKLKKAIRAGKMPRCSRKKKSQIEFNEEQCREKLSRIWTNFEQYQEMWKTQGKDLNIIRAFHGTSLQNVEPIFQQGFRIPWRGGMLGRGIYVGPIAKAKNYSDGIVLIVEVMLGNCKELCDVEKLENNSQYNSMHLGAGRRTRVYKGYLRNEEWVIRNPNQIRIVGIALCPARRY